MTPEQKAREIIDKKLEQSGWIVQDRKLLNLFAGLGVAVREFPTGTGPVDYTSSCRTTTARSSAVCTAIFISLRSDAIPMEAGRNIPAVSTGAKPIAGTAAIRITNMPATA